MGCRGSGARRRRASAAEQRSRRALAAPRAPAGPPPNDVSLRAALSHPAVACAPSPASKRVREWVWVGVVCVCGGGGGAAGSTAPAAGTGRACRGSRAPQHPGGWHRSPGGQNLGPQQGAGGGGGVGHHPVATGELRTGGGGAGAFGNHHCDCTLPGRVSRAPASCTAVTGACLVDGHGSGDPHPVEGGRGRGGRRALHAPQPEASTPATCPAHGRTRRTRRKKAFASAPWVDPVGGGGGVGATGGSGSRARLQSRCGGRAPPRAVKSHKGGRPAAQPSSAPPPPHQ